ncbi:MAG TPA: hypothetical protein VM425_11495 [Myxococcota bacterium]|nr:hypothetical protein [Myxococcota bacterium]
MKTRALFWMMMVATVGGVVGCVDNDKSLVISFASPLSDTDCLAQIQTGGSFVYISRGLLDIGHPAFGGYPQYSSSFQMENRLVANANEDIGELEANDIQLRKGMVSYEWLDGRDVLEAPENAVSPVLMLENQVEVDTYISGLVGAGSGDSPGVIVTSIRLVSPQVGSSLMLLQNIVNPVDLDRVVLGLHLRIEGETLGGRDVESNDFVFPISFCSGCLGTGTSACKDENGADILDINGNPIYPGCRPGQDTNADLTCADITGN